eukprot:c9684_g1_i3.p2 GENE.c9684_g1_i3~~c9684_g1_i3.p2  ORF type:complete len:336 (-),score=91.22 c9684_g1_i3:95-1102(-)
MSEAQEKGWMLKVSGGKCSGKCEIPLPSGENTKFSELKSLCAKATKIAQKRLQLKRGFPPTIIDTQSISKHTTIADLGLQNNECLIAAEDTTTTSATSPASDEEASKVSAPLPPPSVTKRAATIRGKKRTRIHMPSTGGHRVGSIDDEGGSDVDESESSTSSRAFQSPYDQIAINIASAASGATSGDRTVNSVLKSLRECLKSAREKVGAEQAALDKVVSALSGTAEFKDIADGSFRMIVTYHKSKRTLGEECVQNIPTMLLSAILCHMAQSPEDANRLDATSMALLSPRMFWSVVRNGGVGVGKSFEQALSEIAPTVNWSTVHQRQRKRPERYR